MDAICLDWSDGQLVAVPGFAPEGYRPMLPPRVRVYDQLRVAEQCERALTRGLGGDGHRHQGHDLARMHSHVRGARLEGVNSQLPVGGLRRDDGPVGNADGHRLVRALGQDLDVEGPLLTDPEGQRFGCDLN